ncbi:MAG: hypothetical protein AAF957_13040 [Planctomycetota bacterium]
MHAFIRRSLAAPLLLALLTVALGACGPSDAPDAKDDASALATAAFDSAIARWDAAFDVAHGARADLVDDGLDQAIVVVRSIVRQTGTMKKQLEEAGDPPLEPDARSARARRQVETMYAHNLDRLNELRARRAEAVQADRVLEQAWEALAAAADGLDPDTPLPPAEGDVDALASEANKRATELHSTQQKRVVWRADLALMEELKERPNSGLEASWVESQIEEGQEKLRTFDEREIKQRGALEEARAAYARAVRAERVRSAIDGAARRRGKADTEAQ